MILYSILLCLVWSPREREGTGEGTKMAGSPLVTQPGQPSQCAPVIGGRLAEELAGCPGW